jgi:hypothetical protein
MKDKLFKQIYAFVLLAAMMGWAAGMVWVVLRVAGSGKVEVIDLLAAVGLSGLMGWFMAKNGDIIQHFYRKGFTEASADSKQ